MPEKSQHFQSPFELRKRYVRLFWSALLILLCPPLVGLGVSLIESDSLRNRLEEIVIITAMILILVFPFLLWRAEQLRQRLKLYPKWSYCQRCGYDLYATPGRCPECGPRVW